MLRKSNFVLTNLFKYRAVYEIKWKNIAEWGRPQMTIWHMRIACWMTKATDTQSEYVILTAFPLQQWLQDSASMFCYACFACLVILTGK